MTQSNLNKLCISGANGVIASQQTGNASLRRGPRQIIVADVALPNSDAFSDKYSPVVRLGVLVGGAALSWLAIFGAAHVFLG